MSAEDRQRQAYQDALQEKQERARVQRLQVYDKQGEDMRHEFSSNVITLN